MTAPAEHPYTSAFNKRLRDRGEKKAGDLAAADEVVDLVEAVSNVVAHASMDIGDRTLIDTAIDEALKAAERSRGRHE